MSAIVNDGSDIIQRTINTKLISSDLKNLDHFEIDSTIDWINKNKFKKIGLQFPDELLPISIPISLRLKAACAGQFGIMADTSFGSCCVDEVAGEHFDVDAIIHYGNACLTSTHRKLPVKYVFGDSDFSDSDIANHVEAITSYLRAEIAEQLNKICLSVLYDFRYLRYSRAVSDALRQRGCCTHLSIPNLPEYRSDDKIDNLEQMGARLIERCSSPADAGMSRVALFVSDSSDHSVKSVLLSQRHRWTGTGTGTGAMLLCSPDSARVRDISAEIGRLARSRLYSVEVARSARRVGLLLGTLSAERVAEASARLARLMRRRGKLVYPLVVGRINAPKLANFADLDALVILSCPDTCLRFSDRTGGGGLHGDDEFLRPVVTPFEMCCACATDGDHDNGGIATASTNLLTDRYVTDYRELLATMEMGALDEQETIHSLVTGRIAGGALNLGYIDNHHHGDDKALLSRRDADWTVAAVDGRAARSWFGLDPQLGQTPVSMVTEGRSGIASGYRNESSDL